MATLCSHGPGHATNTDTHPRLSTNTKAPVHHTSCTKPTTSAATTTAASLSTTIPPVRELIACLQVCEDALRAHPLEVFQKVITTPGRPVQMVSAVTPFHSSAPPPIALPAYALRIAHHSGYGADGLAVGLALVGRYLKVSGTTLSPLTAHRLLATCIVVGMKASCDRFVKNVYMAPIVGVPLPELNALEVALLKSLSFSAIPEASEVHGIIASLRKMKDEVAPATITLQDALIGSAKSIEELSKRG